MLYNYANGVIDANARKTSLEELASLARRAEGGSVMSRTMTSQVIDASAITLSGLCLIHCLALPIVAVALPLAGMLAEAEWVHRAFVLLAVPISCLAMVRSIAAPGGVSFAILALVGLTLLLAAAFLEPLHEVETLVTVAGALLLATAHIWRWIKNRPHASRAIR